MSDESMVAVDSLVANEFAVEINGEKLMGVFRVSGLVTFKLVGKDEHNIHVEKPPFTLAKMVQRDGNTTFNKWLRETVSTPLGKDRPRRDLAIVAIDDGVETRRWTASGAWISEVRYSEFDTALSDMVEEIVVVHYDALSETWPATPDLE